MAPQRVLKSLNKGPGKKRFVFKSFAQRVEEVDVDVFRSLAPVKLEPTSGSSFFHENLLRWRELNAAADFNAVYVELLPVVQTLPQLLLQKDLVMKSLLSRVRLSAALSLEPILSLIALLARDLREEFLPYLSKFLDTCSDLLKSGADQEPELLEQVFISISYIIKYLMKFLTGDILFVLRVTKRLRYYQRTFVQDFVAESVSYLLRKSPPKQLIKGVRRLFTEVEADPSELAVSSSCRLLFHTLKGPAFGLHSQAESLLHLLLDRSTLTGVQKKSQGDGGKVAVQVVSKTFLMLCEHIKREKLEALWVCLIEHISGKFLDGHARSEEIIQDSATAIPEDDPTVDHRDSGPKFREVTVSIVEEKSLSDPGGPGPPPVSIRGSHEEIDSHPNGSQSESDQMHLVRLLSLLTDVLEFRKGSRVNDYKPLFALVPRLLGLQVFSAMELEQVHCVIGPLAPLRVFQDGSSELLSEVFRYLLALLSSHAQVAGASSGPGYIAAVAPTWAIAFDCQRVNCLMPFLKGLVDQEVALVRIFAPEILWSLDQLIEDYPVDVLPLLLDICEKLESAALLLSNQKVQRLKCYVVSLIEKSMEIFQTRTLKSDWSRNAEYIEVLALDPAVVWMALQCLHYFGVGEKLESLAWDYAVALDHALSDDELKATEEWGNFFTFWECLLAASMSSHTKLLIKGQQCIAVQHVYNYVDLAVTHRTSSQVLNAVGQLLEASSKDIALEYASRSFESLLQVFGPNLSASNKSLRTVTLRILSYHELLQAPKRHVLDHSYVKRQKGNNGQVNEREGTLHCQPFQHLLAVESGVLSHENFRQSSLLINAVKVTACAKKIPEFCVVHLFNALLGVLHNRFSLLWEPVTEALAAMLEVHGNTVGQELLSYLEVTQVSFLSEGRDGRKEDMEEDMEVGCKDLWTRFGSYLHDEICSTQTGTLLMLHLKILQKVATYSEARSRHLIPLFLTFVGHSGSLEESHQIVSRAGKDWKAVLKEWLMLIKELRNARSLFQGPTVKGILLNRFLSDSDPTIQQITFECLLNWKDKYLIANEEHLKNLISSKTVREELTTWDVSKASHLIQDEDREPLLNVVLLLLYPKIMRRTIKSMGKSGVGVQRNSVLSFLARFESRELAPLFAQLVRPLQSAFVDIVTSHKETGKPNWFSGIIEEGETPQFIQHVDREAVAALPYKRKLGFLHMVMDSLEIFSSVQLTPYLFALLSIVLRLLETCVMDPKDENYPSFTSDGSGDKDRLVDLASNLERIGTVQVKKGGESSSLSELALSGAFADVRPAIGSTEIAESCVLAPVDFDAPQAEGRMFADKGLHTFEEDEETDPFKELKQTISSSTWDSQLLDEKLGHVDEQGNDSEVPEDLHLERTTPESRDEESRYFLQVDPAVGLHRDTPASDGALPILDNKPDQIEVEQQIDGRVVENVETSASKSGGEQNHCLLQVDADGLHPRLPAVPGKVSVLHEVPRQEIANKVSKDVEISPPKSMDEENHSLLQDDVTGPQQSAPSVDGVLHLLDGKPEQVGHEQERGSRVAVDAEFTTYKVRGGGVREVRTLCFRILATVMRKFENVVFPPQYWDIFFHAIEHSVRRFVEENSFTNGPSSLMQCFLAMSQRMDIAPFLTRDPSLVPNVLSVLAVKGADSEVVSAILKLVENILDLLDDSNDNEEMESVKAIFVPHLDVLLSSFGVSLSFHRETAIERRSLKRELKILTKLSKYIQGTDIAGKLQDVLLPMLRVRKRMDQDLCLEVLHLLQGIGPLLPITSTRKCLPVLAPLLSVSHVPDIRIAVCATLVALARVDDTLLSVAELITDLNSMSSSTIDEFDYGRRLHAYDRLSGTLFSQLTRAQTLLVLSHVIYDMGSEDISLRHRASDCLQKYVKFAASLPDHNVEGNSNIESDEHADNGNDHVNLEPLKDEESLPKAARESLKSLVPNFLLPHIRNGMGSEVLVVRREWILLLREIAANFPGGATLQEYHCLISNDLEADFFHNVVHLQVHRRIKAMGKFKAICVNSPFSQGALSRIFVPLFMHSLFEARGDKEGNLVTVAVETLSCIARQLPWEPYFGLLMHCFRSLASKSDHQKVLVRLVCAILDAFHFFTPLPVLGNENKEEDADVKNESGEIDRSDDRLPNDQGIVRQLPAAVLSVLQNRVLPEIRRLMISKEGIVSTPVALTQVKILMLMPKNIVEVELPQVVRTVINSLKSRSQAVRDEARAALVVCTETLGANYLHFIVDVLQGSLTKGFELHVLGYTLNSILVKLVPKLHVGELDYCLDQLLEVLENDIMGEVADEKDVEAIAIKMKETKHMRSFESLKLLAQVVTFRSKATALLGVVRRNLQKSLIPKVKPKLENILQHIALGFQHNKSVTQPDLLVIVYAIVEDGVKEEKELQLAAAARKQAKIDKLASVSGPAAGDNVVAAKSPIPHFNLITEFALQLLHSHLKRVKVSRHDVDTLAMLNPLVGLLQECLKSKYDGVLASALKTLSLLLLLPLPAIDACGSKITTLVFSICQRFAKTENPLLQACLNVLTILIRQCKALRLSEDQLRALLEFPIFTDMEGGSRMALSLLKSIISRKLLVPELYDMINRVAQLMVTSYVGPVRQLCSQIMLQFLLDYPLGKKRLQQHLDFFITNIGYSEPSGREAALEMLHTVILKFPHSVVEEHAESMFFPLVTSLVNDESNQVRSMIGAILKVLMSQVGPRTQERMVDFAISWYKGADQRLWRTAAQVLGFLIEVMGTRFEKYAGDVLPECIKILEQESCGKDTEERTESDETGKTWQDAYFSLTMMEKLFQQLPNLILLPDVKKFWVRVCHLLLHQHFWVRKACGRLLSIYFAACGEPSSQRLEAAALGTEDILFFHPSWILLLAASFCQQLHSGAIDDAMGEQLVKMLDFICSLLPLLPQVTSSRSLGKVSFLGCDDAESQERVSRALVLLGWEDRSQKGENKERKDPDLQEDGNEKHGPNWALSIVFKKLQKIALRVHPVQTKVVLRCYAAVAPRLGTTVAEQYLHSMITVLTKITEGSAAKVVSEEMRSLGEDVLNQLRELVGATRFVKIYNDVREKMKENREKRKRAQKISVLVDPEQNARRKIKESAKRQAQKKRKIIKGKVKMGL